MVTATMEISENGSSQSVDFSQETLFYVLINILTLRGSYTT